MIPTIPHDKAMHAVYGALAGLAGALIAIVTGQHPGAGALIGGVVVGVGKEVIDRATGKGTPDPMDAVATILGAMPCAVVGSL